MNAEADILAFCHNFAIVCKPLKLYRPVRHCKKRFLTAHVLRYWWHIC